MKKYMEQRILEEAAYIIKTKDTIRATAKKFKVSKTTVHKDMAERLKYVNPLMEQVIKKILHKNLEEKHIRGGEATKRKYSSDVK
ncbi:sporulation transcriptional regulator SpoIIID [Clostridium sp. SYSU_GA19001]|uniref:sporulation transcriptional regulator SpoIIID n=1 Tax=Clostridium caldaquaticum TaxID=2940653 RepID=UPI002076E074|nr:sporulation transcriptional regulator SpoIIID [Clostridium caldaquaticum]MCM8710512.1 sporulation transcriptional regulator SpoIIID [Clostridium caldaquaticum]